MEQDEDDDDDDDLRRDDNDNTIEFWPDSFVIGLLAISGRRDNRPSLPIGP